MNRKPIIPDYLPPGLRNVDQDPLGKKPGSARGAHPVAGKGPNPDGRPRPPYNDALAPPGTCRGCGCTDEDACPPGCWWVDAGHTLCSTCAALGAGKVAGDLARELGAHPVVAAVTELAAGALAGRVMGRIGINSRGQSKRKRRKAQKPVKVAMSPPALAGARRRGGKAPG